MPHCNLPERSSYLKLYVLEIIFFIKQNVFFFKFWIYVFPILIAIRNLNLILTTFSTKKKIPISLPIYLPIGTYPCIAPIGQDMGKLTHLVWSGFASYIYVTCLLQCTSMIQPMLIFIVGSPLPFLSQTP